MPPLVFAPDVPEKIRQAVLRAPKEEWHRASAPRPVPNRRQMVLATLRKSEERIALTLYVSAALCVVAFPLAFITLSLLGSRLGLSGRDAVVWSLWITAAAAVAGAPVSRRLSTEMDMDPPAPYSRPARLARRYHGRYVARHLLDEEARRLLDRAEAACAAAKVKALEAYTDQVRAADARYLAARLSHDDTYLTVAARSHDTMALDSLAKAATALRQALGDESAVQNRETFRRPFRS